MPSNAVAALAAFRALAEPQDGLADGPFKLVSTLSAPADLVDIECAWPDKSLPEEIVDAWLLSNESRLFEDVEYGQWGLVLLSPKASALQTATQMALRPSQFSVDDVVIGEFLGDLELVVMFATEGPGAQVMIARPLDARKDWPIVGTSLADFLRKYFAANGEKYWE